MLFADVAELADALDLGSSVTDVGVQVPSSAPKSGKQLTAYIWRDVWVVERAGLENQWRFRRPRVRIPLSPPFFNIVLIYRSSAY